MDESKVGGTFLWPGDEPWPFCSVGHAQSEPQLSLDAELLREEAESRERWRSAFEPYHRSRGEPLSANLVSMPAGEPHGAYIGVIQLRAADVPEPGFPDGYDLFQLLWCPRDHNAWGWGPAPRVYWRQTRNLSAVLQENPVPAVFEDGYMPHACQFIPERVQEYPHIEDLPGELQERIRDWQKTDAAAGYSYHYHLSVAPGTKIGGHVHWVQAPDVPICASCQQQMEHLLTIASREWDGESWRTWRPLEEEPLADGVPRYDGQDAGLLLGDAGDMYVFICRRCPGWPIAYTLQCS